MNTLPAVERACELVELLGAGEVVDGVIDILNYVPQPRPCSSWSRRRSTPCWAPTSPRRRWCRILKKLDFQVEGRPGHRALLACRRGGAWPIWPRRWPGSTATTTSPPPSCGARPPGAATPRARSWSSSLGSVCRACGYDEIITYSFISPTYYDKIRWAADDPRRAVLQDPQPPGGGHLHHAHHRAALHAGDPDPELQLPQQVRQAVRGGPHLSARRGGRPGRWRPRCSLWAPTARIWTSSP